MTLRESTTLDFKSNLRPIYGFEGRKVFFAPIISEGRIPSFLLSRVPNIADPFQNWWRSLLDQSRRPSLPADAPVVNYIDLFSSVGGLSLGFSLAAETLGIAAKSLFAADLDESALHVYKENFSPRHVSNMSVAELIDYKVSGQGLTAKFDYTPTVIDSRLKKLIGEVDVVLAGPPCQGHSTLNNHSRGDDPRNLLYLTVPAVAIALEATALIIENVPNVVNDKNGVVETTKNLLKDAGYRISYATISSSDLGWAQTRKRYFMVARKGNAPVDLSILVNESRRPASPVSWLLSDMKRNLQDNALMSIDPILSEANQKRVAWLFDNDAYDLPDHIRPVCHQGGHTYPSVYGRMRWEEPAPTLTTGFMSPGRGRYVHPLERRTLRAREAARIQGFPDWFNFCPPNLKNLNRGMLAKWIGDAVPSILGFLPALSILDGLERKEI